MLNPALASLLIGQKTEVRSMDYTWRDVALYALAVGAKAHELNYTFEKNMKALPTFGVVPYWGTVNVRPHLSRPKPASVLAEPYVNTAVAPLHIEHELIMAKPIDPIKGTFVFQDVITDVYDRGTDKGIVAKTRADIHDEAGNLVCTNISSTLFPRCGGYGGEPLPKSTACCPDCACSYSVDDVISPTQNLLYRLTGDTNLVHVDPEAVRERGYDRVFMQGLCSFGFACRMAVGVLIPGMAGSCKPDRSPNESHFVPGYPDHAATVDRTGRPSPVPPAW